MTKSSWWIFSHMYGFHQTPWEYYSIKAGIAWQEQKSSHDRDRWKSVLLNFCWSLSAGVRSTEPALFKALGRSPWSWFPTHVIELMRTKQARQLHKALYLSLLHSGIKCCIMKAHKRVSFIFRQVCQCKRLGQTACNQTGEGEYKLHTHLTGKIQFNVMMCYRLLTDVWTSRICVGGITK